MTEYIISALSIGIILLLGCVGEILNEKSGHLNLGMPGVMAMGAFGGCFGIELYMNTLADITNPSWLAVVVFAVLFSALFSALGGLIYAFLTVTLRCNQNISGLALTTFGAGFADHFMKPLTQNGFTSASNSLKKSIIDVIPGIGKLGWFSDIFLSHGILFYLAIVIAIVVAIIFKKTRIGLNLRAVGENPATADAAGINITTYKYCSILIGCAIAGLAGLYYVMVKSNGSWENSSTVQEFGWLAIALVIFSLWKPNLAILGSFLFGLLYVFNSYCTTVFGIKLPSTAFREIIKLLPYVVTIIVLIITSIIGKKETQPPAALGVSYFREER